MYAVINPSTGELIAEIPNATDEKVRAAIDRAHHERGEIVELLTVNEVAVTLRVSKMTVYRLIHAGRLAAIRVGQSLRLPRGSVDAFVTIR
jgi:excisionase family DNA binding protein